MTSIQTTGIQKRAMRCFAVVILFGAAFLGTSEASTITVTPVSQTILLGGTATVDLVLSGLNASETVGGFELNLQFNPAIITGASLANNPDNVMGAFPLDLTSGTGFVGINVHPDYLADALITEPALKLLEGSGFRLARITFTGVAEGLSPLTLTQTDLSDYTGLNLLPASTRVNGSVCVDNPQTGGDPCVTRAPEPSSLSLLLVAGVAMAGIVARSRRPARTKA